MRQDHHICKAKTRQGGECQQFKVSGRERCRMHGGASPVGPAAGNFKTGRYSRFLPFGLKERFDKAMEDPDWLSLEKEIRLVDATMEEVFSTLSHGGEIREYEVERITSLIDQRRKLVESESKRLKDHSHTITIDQMLVLTRLFLDAVKESADKHFPNHRETRFLADLNQAIHRLLSRSDPRGVQPVKQIN